MWCRQGRGTVARAVVALGIAFGAAGVARADDALVDQGAAALTIEEYDAAAEAFAAVLKANPNHPRALHGQAMCQYHKGQADQAIATLKRAIAAAGEKVDRAMVLNLAAIYLEREQGLAAATLCQEYLARRPEPVDEPVLVALGAALVQSMPESQATAEWGKASQAHGTYTAKLEQARPGMRLWGTEWVTDQRHAELRQAGEQPVYPPALEPVAIDDLTPPPLEDGAVAGDAGATSGGKRPGEAAAATGPQEAIAIPIAPDLLIAPLASIANDVEVHVQSTADVMLRARVVRTDAAKGLALLKVQGAKMHYLNLADRFDGGPLQCAAVTKPVVFSISPTNVAGTAKAPAPAAAKEPWAVELEEKPTLAGSPLTSGGKIVGVALLAKGDDVRAVPAIPLQAIRTFLGADLPKPSRVLIDPKQAVYHVATKEKKGE